jgi:membrane protein DedA with SNARE-associated domain
MSRFLEPLLTAPGWVVYGLVSLIVFAEDALFVGFVLPGETAAVLGGVAAKLGHVSLGGILVAVIAAAIVGDTVGYEVGRHLGPRILAWRFLDSRRAKLDRARDLLARRGGAAVFFGRWTAFLRAVTPALAGTVGMPYRQFVVFNAAGGILWGTVVVLAGYAAGASYAKVERALGRGTALAVLAVVVVGLLVWQVRRHRADRPLSP